MLSNLDFSWNLSARLPSRACYPSGKIDDPLVLFVSNSSTVFSFTINFTKSLPSETYQVKLQKGLPLSLCLPKLALWLVTVSPGGIQQSPTVELITCHPLLHCHVHLKCLRYGCTYFNSDYFETSLCKAVVSANSPHCHESKCPPHDVRTYQGRTSRGMFKPDWALAGKCSYCLPVNEYINEQSLGGTFCAPTCYIFVCAYIHEPWAFDCLDSWRLTG